MVNPSGSKSTNSHSCYVGSRDPDRTWAKEAYRPASPPTRSPRSYSRCCSLDMNPPRALERPRRVRALRRRCRRERTLLTIPASTQMNRENTGVLGCLCRVEHHCATLYARIVPPDDGTSRTQRRTHSSYISVRQCSQQSTILVKSTNSPCISFYLRNRSLLQQHLEFARIRRVWRLLRYWERRWSISCV